MTLVFKRNLATESLHEPNDILFSCVLVEAFGYSWFLNYVLINLGFNKAVAQDDTTKTFYSCLKNPVYTKAF